MIVNTNHVQAADFMPARQLRAHQRVGFALSADAPNFALLMEQRTGKTAIVLATAAYQYEKGAIDALLVVAWPQGVHRNWIEDEVPQDIPERIPYKALAWRSGKANTKAFKNSFQELLDFKGLAILGVNAEALTSEVCKKYLRRFLKARRLLVVGDESTWFKSPGAKRTKTMRSIGQNPNVRFRRILDGTPLESPLDLYSQFAFLDLDIIGQPDFTTFKARYSEWEDKETKAGQAYKALVRYTNLDELRAKIAPFSYRVLRRECADLPPKTYRKRYVQLSPEQRRVYDALRDEYRAELSDGRRVDVPLVLTRYLRLQEVLSNRLAGDVRAEVCPACLGDGCEACRDEGVLRYRLPPTVIDPTAHPRLSALEEELKEPRPVIVWARFRHEVDEILALCQNLGRKPCRYDGVADDDQKLAARRGFAAGLYDTFVGNQRAGGRGVKLAAAEAIIYYSNTFGLLDRLQSEDRAEDLGRAVSTEILDLVAEDTIDEPIVAALRSKKSVADLVTGDDPRAWL
jgi:hypothetical protein